MVRKKRVTGGQDRKWKGGGHKASIGDCIVSLTGEIDAPNTLHIVNRSKG